MCFVGLLLVSQVSGIAAAQGLAHPVVLASTSALTLGYLLGSLLGGHIVERLGSWRALVSVNLLALTGLLVLGMPVAAMVLAGAWAIGFTFGSTASIMPVLIGLRFGSRWIGAIYGRLMIAYGLAGVLAPWTSGVLYEIGRSYSSDRWTRSSSYRQRQYDSAYGERSHDESVCERAARPSLPWRAREPGHTRGPRPGRRPRRSRAGGLRRSATTRTGGVLLR
jgi:MFS family permease